jgi:hypothetical protein
VANGFNHEAKFCHAIILVMTREWLAGIIGARKKMAQRFEGREGQKFHIGLTFLDDKTA